MQGGLLEASRPPAYHALAEPRLLSVPDAMPDNQKILLIEDDREISTTLSGVLRGAGYDVMTAPNGVEGQKLIQQESPALVITDMMMPRMGGFPVLDFINTLQRKPAVIMITANEGGRHKAYAEMLGVVDYLRKPFPMESLLEAVSKALGAQAQQTAAASDEPPLGPLRRGRGKKKSDD
jgi:DNA-binding response OmpR family regulator